MDTSTAIQIAVPVVLGGVWLIRLEGRINTLDSRVGDIKDDLKYIRQRIDKALNGHNHDSE
jgi:hypothetical protein